jgi:SAM-dependent methyltransferase
MKPFSTYQYIEGTEMTERDKIEVGSRFWNKGKWDNYVAPFMPLDCSGLNFVDMGCNSGLFLRLAQERGFERVVGVDSDPGAVLRGNSWKERTNGNYKILQMPMENCIGALPVADYTVLANAHYYFTINDWLDYLDKLQYKTRYCIIVTAEKQRPNRCWAATDLESIRTYFKNWEEVGFIDIMPNDGNDPSYRKLWGLCFKSPFIERVPVESLDSGNHVQDEFYKELDEGKAYNQTKYYRIIEKYRRGKWSPEKLEGWFCDRVKLYEEVKERGLARPIYANKDGLILDGNHRYSILKHLGAKDILIRRT